ncbi:MAG: M1 family aminopeptidase [Gammaproteobacteria bacterium]|nr:M1 family aminopeptidase [Gammaproteobacteria bacterium]
MKEFLEVMQFELRYQLRSPFFLGALLIFALIHFFTITGTGIHLDISALAAINSPHAILQTELILAIFGLLPVVAFVTTAVTRDFEHGTAALVYVTPIRPQGFLLGRFAGVLLLTWMIGLAGLLGTMIGTFMPWLDQERVASFALTPYAYALGVIILPNMLIVAALFFAVAALTRSVALTFALALVLFVADVLLRLYARLDADSWLLLADPFGGLAVAAETRYWSVVELNSNFPVGQLPANRQLWVGLALSALLWTLWRFRLDLAEQAGRSGGRRQAQRHDASMRESVSSSIVSNSVTAKPSFTARDSFAQFLSQLRMDLGCVCKSPLLYVIVLLGIAAVVGEHNSNVGPLLNMPLYPLTSLMLGFMRYGMLQFIMLIAIFYAAELIHRERESGTDGIIHAAPFQNWIMVLAKTVALCLVVSGLMLVVMLTSIVLQAAAGYTHFELRLYLQSVFLYNGFYYWMLCILAVVIQVLSPHKWLGMLLTLSVFIVLQSLQALGYDHVLYAFSIPNAVYSDMNGFGHFAAPVLALTGYWAAFCVLLVIVGLLFYPRGQTFTVRERLAEARARSSAGVVLGSVLAGIAFVSSGAWIFYNTNILNEYLTPDERLQRQVDYETEYGRYENLPTPSFDGIRMEVDIFPAERRLESRGSATLGNHKRVPISEFVVSINPILQVQGIAVENAVLLESDEGQGFYLYRLDTALAPGATVEMSWHVTRSNRGFVVANADNELVSNGTFVETIGAMPIPGYDSTRRITDNSLRRQYGLPPAPRLPTLGDAAHLDSLAYGIDSRTDFEIVLSTSADQIAIAPGVLQSDWVQDERHYFHYMAEAPILPGLAITSARYAVARDRWNDVSIEIYYHPQHANNIDAMLETAKRGLEYYSSEFAPYQYSYFRMIEYPRYRTNVQAFPGTVAYSEATGFVVDLRQWANVDYATLHELAHMWWGDRITGAQMQGRQMLNETMAQYSTLMFFKEHYPPEYANRIAAQLLDNYLNGRSSEGEAELPLMYTEEQGNISYNKGPLVLYALQDILDEEVLHQALRNFLDEYSFQTAPFPMSRDLVNALRAVAGEEHQSLVTDLFERITFYDLQLESALARIVDGGYEIVIEVTGRQLQVDGSGVETEVPLDSWFDVALFSDADADEALDAATPLVIERQRLHSGRQTLTLRTTTLPELVVLDPLHKTIERTSTDNDLEVTLD